MDEDDRGGWVFPSYNPDACCSGGGCFAIWSNTKDTPCWGDSEVETELYDEEDWEWLHACRGHMDMFDCEKYGETYKVSDRPEDQGQKPAQIDV